MGNDEKMKRIKQISRKKLAVKLATGNQERTFMNLCNHNEISVVKRTRESEDEQMKPIYPIWYAITFVGNSSQPVAWWSLSAPDQYLSVNVKAFGEMLKE